MSAEPGDSRAAWLSGASLAALLAVLAVVLVRTAWVSDDAYITFRTIDNWLHGYGLRWNPAERVQSYTHPLWLFAMAAAAHVTGEYFRTAMVVGMAVSLAALGVLAFAVSRTRAAAVLVLVLALGSKAFIDYATSGLENPLTHLLLAGFLALYLRGDWTPATIVRLGLIAGLAAVNRLDSVLLYLPALAWVAWSQRWARATLRLLPGLAPLVLWESFSLLYYGVALPNTAYAKLDTGIERAALVGQGLHYLANSLRSDPVTLLAIAWGCAAATVQRSARAAAVVAGIAAYLVYVVWIGGDFMSGRFLTAPFVAAVCLIARSDLRFSQPRTLLALGGTLAAALLIPAAPIWSGSGYGLDRESLTWDRGISDERRWYFQWSGWLRDTETRYEPINSHALRGKQLREGGPATARFGALGFLGFNAGPDVHIVDSHGLCDPLLARLPAFRDPDWRIGHFKRLVPRGYMRTLMRGTNDIQDPALAEFYDALVRVTRAPLFDRARWRTIWQLNTGALDHLVDTDAYRDPSSALGVHPMGEQE